MIILLLNLGPNFENIQEQILTGTVIPNFDEALARLLRHTSTATQSMHTKITPDTFVMVSQSYSRSDSKGGRGSNRGQGQRPHCTYCNRLGHTRDRCYQLHGQPPRIAHLTQSSDHSTSSSSVSGSSSTPPPRIAHLAQSSDHSASLSFVLGNSSTPQGVVLTLGEYEEYLRLTQASKSSSIALLSRLVMFLIALRIHLHLGSFILEPLIISLVIKTYFLPLPFHLLYPLLP